jgi:hypothetical protein
LHAPLPPAPSCAQGLFHNASELVHALWTPGEGTLYGHTNLAAVAAAAAAGDARALADAYLPPHRGRALPSLATLYNVGLLADGAVISLDASLLAAVHVGTGGWTQQLLRFITLGLVDLGPAKLRLTACSLQAMRRSGLRSSASPNLAQEEPEDVTICRERSAAAYLKAASSHAAYTFPNASQHCAVSGAALNVSAPSLTPHTHTHVARVACALSAVQVEGLSPEDVRVQLELAAAHGADIIPLVYAGEVGADPRVSLEAAPGAVGSGRRIADLAAVAVAGQNPQCVGGGGWTCSQAHGLDYSDEQLKFAVTAAVAGGGVEHDGRPLMLRASRVFVKEQLLPRGLRK